MNNTTPGLKRVAEEGDPVENDFNSWQIGELPIGALKYCVRGLFQCISSSKQQLREKRDKSPCRPGFVEKMGFWSQGQMYAHERRFYTI